MMKASLEGSYLKLLTCKQRDNERAVWCSRKFVLNRQEARFLVHQKRVTNGFSVTFEHKCVGSISASSSHQTDDESEEIQTMNIDQLKTVRVRIKLQKECAFGQQFLLVGDDPIVGLWDPFDGVPLIWSEGHVWTAEIDLPSGKVINYKFILKGDSESISWQPGPDRILETWDTDKTITVFEDWDNAELQNINEEENVADVRDESLIDSDLSIVAENLNQFVNANNDHTDRAESQSAPMAAEDPDDLADDKSKEDANKAVNGIILDEVVPVLVPGLIPIHIEETEDEELKEVEIKKVENAIDEIEDFSAESEETDETMMMMIDQKQQIYGADHILESDMQWGRRTLQKFLANFGFQ